MIASLYKALSTSLIVLWGLFPHLSEAQSTQLNQVLTDSSYLETVQEFADNVLEHGRDTYGDVHSPLFVDGIQVKTLEPVKWEHGETSWIISNFGSQQNLMRVLVGLSALTGDKKYREAASEAVEYMYDYHSDSTGLLYWGGHQFVDLKTMRNQFEGRPHELKNNYPFYEFMWAVDSVRTRQMLHAMWNAHILDWNKLDLNRHGEYDLAMDKLWNHKFSQPEPFFEGDGLTFINAGTDMIQAALALYALGREQGAKTWGIRLYQQYVRARHPETNLGVYQYSQPTREVKPPQKGPLTGELTFSKYGDRAQNQFGEVYGDIAKEGNVLWGGRMHTLYGKSPIMILHLAEQLKDSEAGKKLLEWTLSGIKAYVSHAYDAQENHYKPMWTDGTDLTGQKMPRTGYYGEKGTKFKSIEPNGAMMLALAKAIRLSTDEPVLWQAIRHQFMGAGLGDPGKRKNSEPALNVYTDNNDAVMLVTVLEMYRETKTAEFLQLAERIGSNILQTKFHNGFFVPSENHKYAKFDTPEPLALLMLVEAKIQDDGLVPPYVGSYGSTDGEPEKDGRPSDEDIYEETFE